MIRFEDISVSFGNGSVLAHINLVIPNQRRTVLLGPSGSGKSTLLRLINRLIEPTSGNIHYGHRPLCDIEPTELRRSIGFVSQRLGLFPHWTARQNIARFHQHSQGVEELAASLGLESSQLDRYPHQLSGGQQQRVAIARALASNPPLLLLDEPFSALDPVLRCELQDLILALDKTIIFVTHDLREALRLADHLVFLDQGRIVFDGPTPELHLCSHPRVAAYLRTLES